jgi:hypothetical protein
VIDWTEEFATQVANQWHGDQPHPDAPGVKVKEFATAVKLASQAKFGGHASAKEAEAFWGEFQGMNARLTAQKKEPLTPEEYGQVLDHLAPLSFVYHNRPPSMSEVVKLRDAKPHEVRQHYGDLPDQHYPDVSAADMVKALRAADPHAQEHLGRPPVKLEAAYLVHSGASPSEYYHALSQAQGMPGQQAPPPPAPGEQPGVQSPSGGQGVPAQAG